MEKEPIDLTGMKFNKLAVIGAAPRHPSTGDKMWACKCDCGGETVVSKSHLITGNIKGCGCLQGKLQIEWGKEYRKKYPYRRQIKAVFDAMKQRCNNPNNPRFASYGARGIRVCKEWNSVDIFYDWAMKNGYKPGLTIDRIANNGNYEPNNCRFVTNQENANNKRTNVYYKISGLKLTEKQWSRRFNINIGTLRKRLKKGWHIEKALSEPVDKRFSRTRIKN